MSGFFFVAIIAVESEVRLMNNMLNLLGQIMANPMGALRQKYNNIPENITDWQEAMKYLANNGAINPNQFNQAKQMQSNPMWQMIIGSFFRGKK